MVRYFQKTANVMDRLFHDDLFFFEEQFRYGHREVLLNYSINKGKEVNFQSILGGGLEHGWSPGNLRWVVRNRNLTYAPRYIWNQKRLKAYSERENAIAIGAPWLYMLSDLGLSQDTILKQLPKKPNKIIVIPSHHTLIDANRDILAEIDKIKKVVTTNSDVTVCLFWLDFCNPFIRNTIEKNGWKVFSAGIVSNKPYHTTSQGGRPTFLLELFTLLKDAEIIIVSGAGTAMFYGMTLGAKIQYVQSDSPTDHWGLPDIGINRTDIPGFFDSYLAWIQFEFPELLNTEMSPKPFIQKAWKELGVDSLTENLNADKFKWISSQISSEAFTLYQNRFKQIRHEI